MTSANIMDGINTFVDSKLDTILGGNPITSLANPLIKRIAKNMVKENINPYLNDLEKYLNLAADENGSIDGVLDETIERFNTMPVITKDYPYVGEVSIGQGKVQMSVPMPIGAPKHLTFTEADLRELKDMIIKEFKK